MVPATTPIPDQLERLLEAESTLDALVHDAEERARGREANARERAAEIEGASNDDVQRRLEELRANAAQERSERIAAQTRELRAEIVRLQQLTPAQMSTAVAHVVQRVLGEVP